MSTLDDKSIDFFDGAFDKLIEQVTHTRDVIRMGRIDEARINLIVLHSLLAAITIDFQETYQNQDDEP